MRKVLRWGWVPVVLAFLYSGWVLYQRGAQNRQIEKQVERNRAKEDAAIVENYGGGELKVLAFYANPAVVRQGSRGMLCYGVVNAKTVVIDPPGSRRWAGPEPLRRNPAVTDNHLHFDGGRRKGK